MTKKTQYIVAVILGIFLFLFISVYFGHRRSTVDNDFTVGGNSEITDGGVLSPSQATSDDGTPLSSGATAKQQTAPTWDELERGDSEVNRLQEILDTNNKEDILAQAEFLSISDDPVRRHASLAALVWVNDPDAAQILIPLLDDENAEIAAETQDSLEHILDTFLTQVTSSGEDGELETPDGVDIDDIYDASVAILMGAQDADSCESFMLRVSAFDVKLALPILLEVQENGNDWQRKMATEYIDQVTNHDGVTNREEALIWLLKDQQIPRIDQ